MPSSDLWYPGRIPLCTPQVIRGLGQYTEALRSTVELQDTTYVEVADRIHRDIYEVLFEEGKDCLGSDTDINSLLNMLIQAQEAVELCAEQKCWDELDDVIDAIDTVRWSLILKQEAGGTDDGEEPGSVATPDPDSRASRGSYDEKEPRETDWSQYPTVDQLKAEAEIPSFEDEEEESLDPNEEPLTGP